MTDTVEQSDVEEITNMIEVITARAIQTRVKAFSLRNTEKPSEVTTEEDAQVDDFASNIKHRLNRIQNILDDAIESLGRFAG